MTYAKSFTANSFYIHRWIVVISARNLACIFWKIIPFIPLIDAHNKIWVTSWKLPIKIHPMSFQEKIKNKDFFFKVLKMHVCHFHIVIHNCQFFTQFKEKHHLVYHDIDQVLDSSSDLGDIKNALWSVHIHRVYRSKGNLASSKGDNHSNGAHQMGLIL